MNVLGNATSYSNISTTRYELHQRLRQMNATEKSNPSEKKTFVGTTVAKTIAAGYQVYSDQIRAQRQKRSDASLNVKKLKYQFKDISSKIISSKTSAAARQVASQAKREYMRLKRQQQSDPSGEDEELAAAIAHAKAMERVARKKVRHLEEEEMAKASGGACAGDSVDKEYDEDEDVSEVDESQSEGDMSDAEGSQYADELYADELYANDLAYMDEQYVSEYDYSDIDLDLSNYMTDMEILSEEFLEDISEDITEEMSDSMKEALEDLGFEDLSDYSKAAKGDMDPADLKAMKIKHRNKEMKDIVKADGEYLKAIFKHYQAVKSGAVASGSAMKAASSPMSVGVAASTPQVSMPVDSGASASVGFDITV